MQEILSRRESVRRIALASGYTHERAEDIAQEAALQLIRNPNLISQSPKQAFVDALRSGSEGIYSRAGIPTQPLYESAFENYSDFVNAFGSGVDLESEQIIRSELLDALSCFGILRPNWRLALEMYAEGYNLVEISQRLGCCESRVSQLIKFSRIQIKTAVISKSLSRQEQRKRKWLQSQALPREVQIGFGVQGKISFEVGSFLIKPIEGLVSFTVPKVPQSLFTSF